MRSWRAREWACEWARDRGPCVGFFEDPAPASSPWNTLVNVNRWSYAWPGSTVFRGPLLWAEVRRK